MIDFRNLRSQREFIEEILEKSTVPTACFIGFTGAFAFPLISMITRFAQDKTLPNEFQRLFTRDLIGAGLFFIVSVVFTYTAARIFRGKRAFKSFLIAIGWAGMYGIILSLLLLPVSLAGSYIKPGTPPNLLILLPILVCALAMIIISFYSLKYELVAMKVLFGFGLVRSLTIWILTFIPAFIIYSESTKLSESEKAIAGLAEPVETIDTAKVITSENKDNNKN